MVCADPARGEPAPLRPLVATLRRSQPEIQVRHASRRRLRSLRLIQRMVSKRHKLLLVQPSLSIPT